MTTLQQAALRTLKARERYGWSIEVDAELEKLREALAGTSPPSLSLTAELTPIKAYRCRINGVDLGHVVEAGSLMGITELVNQEGQVLLVDMPQGLAASIDQIFAAMAGRPPIEAPVVKASPSLIARALEVQHG